MSPFVHYSLYELNPITGGAPRKGALLRIHFDDGLVGYADCHPWPELGDPPLHHQLQEAANSRFSTTLLQRSLHFARLDATSRHEGRHLLEGLVLPKSHLLVTTEKDLEKKGFSHAKIKVNRENKDQAVEWINVLAKRGMKIRLDFNCNYSEEEFRDFIKKISLNLSAIDFCEDPFPYDATRWQAIQQEGISLARDRIAEGESREGCVAHVGIWKPAVEALRPPNPRVVVTSYLDHPVGQVCAAYEAARSGTAEVCGLLSHCAYQSTPFSEGLFNTKGTGIGFDDLLERTVFRHGSQVLLNPRLPQDEQERIQKALSEIPLKDHYWFGTSGTTGRSKWIALSTDAILHSAAAVNDHLNSNADDIWLHALPLFHVGGIGICARSQLSGAHVVYAPEKWNPKQFHAIATEKRITLTALVPTQLYDLVQKGFHAPPSLRAAIIGGAALSPTLYRQARDLGWMPLPSYGMTESASQVATATSDSFPRLKRLSHVEVKLTVSGSIAIRSPSLFTMQATFDEHGQLSLIERNPSDWFETEDIAEIIDDYIVIKGRSGDIVKVGGERVNMQLLQHVLEEFMPSYSFDAALFAVDDPRLGTIIALAITGPHSMQVDAFVEAFNARVLPFERIRRVEYIQAIPRTTLGKVIIPNVLRAIH